MSTRCWFQDSLVRIYPIGNRPGPWRPSLEACRRESISFQVAVENTDPETPIRVRVIARPERGLSVRVRRVGFVPLPHYNTETSERHRDCRGHVPGFVPDPLFEEDAALIAGRETAAFWITVTVAPGCPPGQRTVTLEIESDGKTDARREAWILVRDLEMPRRRGFPVTHWLYSDSLLDWYGLGGLDGRYWDILERYVRNLVSHGQDVLYVPVFTPPLDGVKRPTQLLGVQRGESGWRFDWSRVKRYTDLAARCGIGMLEWTHLFTQWGAANAIRVYEGRGENGRLLWRPETAATSTVYRDFLFSFLPALRKFLDREGLRERSLFHLSDEPGGEAALGNYRTARQMVRDMAPWMPTMDALSEIVYGREGITDMPVASIGEAARFVREGIPCWGYFCCGPRGAFLNRLLDTPLAKVRMSGWLFHRFGLRGFLHWGANYWYRRGTRTLIDPFTECAGGDWPTWAYGDPFVVYPGAEGPLDSIRWEVFAESLGDLALLRGVGVDAEDPLLAPIVGFDGFPVSPAWVRDARSQVFDRMSARRKRSA